MALLVPVLFFTGVVIWEVYFSSYTTIEQQRIAVLIHCLAAVAAIIVWIIHVYAAIWVQRFGPGDDTGLCDAGLGLAASSQVAAAPGGDRLGRDRGRMPATTGGNAMRQGAGGLQGQVDRQSARRRDRAASR